jgi:hypothetical protein
MIVLNLIDYLLFLITREATVFLIPVIPAMVFIGSITDINNIRVEGKVLISS